MVVFYRVAGEEEFSSFNLDVGPDGTSYAGQLEAAFPSGAKLEYYAALRTPSGIKYLPREAPAAFASLQLPGTPRLPQAGRRPARPEAERGPAPGTGRCPGGIRPWPMAPSTWMAPSNAWPITRTRFRGSSGMWPRARSGSPTRKTRTAGQVLLNARVVYTNQPFGNQPRWSLGDLQAAYAIGGNKVQVGDMMVQESELTLGGAGRRGFDYTYAGQPLGGPSLRPQHPGPCRNGGVGLAREGQRSLRRVAGLRVAQR